MRLIAAPSLANGSYVAGVDIAMSPGSHTYWKMPGESGVPPVFAFNGSDNIASAEVRFPAPRRITEEGLSAYGYTGDVVFPVLVTPKDPSKPAVLHADVTYAVCNKICLPEHSQADLSLPSGGSAAGGALATMALAKVPVALPAADQAGLVLAPLPGTPKPSWTIAWTGKAPIADVFANAPEGYFFDTTATAPGHWTMTAAQVVAAPNAMKVPVELTLVSPDGGFVTTETLDVAAATK